ncbi:hypothetical protein GH714_028671 [Hevea brasiliensis]|uniref:TAZ-type domain-containing protein n=1 Tax=Hevea brasiliensis TaxID=3981 RepID=A0A6A6M590_HEVBR|nr:hypothetical protein GH714_028671 [Hevea brasiliensis]
MLFSTLPNPNCLKVNWLFRHVTECKTGHFGVCVLCKKMWYLLQLHAPSCKETECHIPRCRDLKEHSRRLKQDTDARHRAAVEEILRKRAADIAGNPAITQLAIMDTGSSLPWVQCSPTEYISQHSPIPLLDPLKSSTYASIPCESNSCQYFPDRTCIKNQCYYNMTYVNAQSSIGNAATEQFIFESLDEGDGANMDGYATPLGMSEAHYYLNLQGIDIGLNELDIDEVCFRRNVTDQSKLTGVIIDSGTPATWLVDQAYDRFRNEVRRTLARLVLEDMGECVYCFCFKGNMTQELQGFPDVIYHFSDGADLQVGFNGIFYQHNSSIFCMAVFPSSQLSKEHFRYVTIIGVMAQQNYNVVMICLPKNYIFNLLIVNFTLISSNLMF